MRIVAHIDMDAFFASVEERDNERFVGLPIVVGSDPEGGKGRGVVSTANYKAREYGIRSALPISKAWEYSENAKRAGKPPAIFLGVNMRLYSDVSSHIMEIVEQYSEEFEQASVDEMYFDLSHLGSFEEAERACKKLKKEIKDRERLSCSIGIGPNKLIAKIASDFQKPDGLTVVTNSEAEKFLEPLTIRKIPGIGPKTEEILNNKGINKVKDLKKFELGELKELLGKFGGDLYLKVRGIDNTEIVEEHEAKSIGEQETFMQNTLDANVITERLNHLCTTVFKRFAKSGFKYFRTISITVRFGDFETKSRAHTFSENVKELSVLEFESLKLLLPFFDARENPKRKAIRLVGVKVEKLS
ncbi:MAG: DNA polymerase IV [Candidatus Jorgensenbacteria bacterium]|nr:DNA polymerase IV [Candidatus Jorgensenbacteria bacterium]